MQLMRLFVFVMVAAVLAGCAELQSMAGRALKDAPKPSFNLRDGRITDLSTEALMLELDVDVSNPYAVPLPLSRAEYGFSFNADDPAKHAISGALEEPGLIPARGSKTVSLPVKLRFEDLMDSVSGLRPGMVVPYRADVTLLADTPGSTQPLSIPLSHEGKLPVPAPPEVEVEGIKWEELSLRKAEGMLKLRVENPNQFEAVLSKLDWGLELNGRKIADGRINKPLELESEDGEALEIPFSVGVMDLGVSAFQMLQGGSASYSLTGDTAVDTPFGGFTREFRSSGSAPMSR